MFNFIELFFNLIKSFIVVTIKVFAPKIYTKYNLQEHDGLENDKNENS